MLIPDDLASTVEVSAYRAYGEATADGDDDTWFTRYLDRPLSHHLLFHLERPFFIMSASKLEKRSAKKAIIDEAKDLEFRVAT